MGELRVSGCVCMDQKPASTARLALSVMNAFCVDCLFHPARRFRRGPVISSKP